MKKKLITIIFIVLAIITFNIYSMASSNCKIYIEDAVKYSNSDNVTVNVCVENINKDIVALGLDVKYDTSKLEYVSSKQGKDMKATMQLAEDVPDEGRVAIGAVAVSGFKNDGVYYSVTFKVKDIKDDIKLSLNVREASNSNGDEVETTVEGGTIKISSEKNDKVEEKSPTNQKIDTFERNDINELTTIEELVTSEGNIEVAENDALVYEVENNEIVEVLDNGMIIPNKDGKTNVRIKLNEENLGNVEVEVKDGKVVKVSGTENVLDFIAASTTEENLAKNEDNEQTNNDVEEKKISNFFSKDNNKNLTNSNEEVKEDNLMITIVIVVIVVIILFFIFRFIRKKKRKSNKFISKF